MRVDQLREQIDFIRSCFPKKLLVSIAAHEFGRDPRNNSVPERAFLIADVAVSAQKLSERRSIEGILISLQLAELANPKLAVELFFSDDVDKSQRGHELLIRLEKIYDVSTQLFALLLWGQHPIGADEATLSLELRSSESVAASTLANAIDAVNKLYNAVAKLLDHSGSELILLKIESGSNIKLDFVGVSDVVKELKNFLLESWNVFRGRSHAKLNDDSEAVLKTLGVLEQINESKEAGRIDEAEAHLLKSALTGSISQLFENKVVLAEIPEVQTVTATALLETGKQRLLPAPNEPRKDKKANPGPFPKKKTPRKKTPRKKTKKKEGRE